MNVLGPLLDLFRPQERAITPQQLFNTGLDELYSAESATGIRVTTELAMRAAIGACVRLLADDISTLPVDAFRKVGKRKEEIEKPDWMLRPSGRLWDTWTNHVSDDVVSLGTDGNAFILAQPHFMGVETLRVLDPEGVDILDSPRLQYRIEGGATLDETEVIHIPWVRLPGTLRGISPVASSRESIGLELAAREWAARFFGNGATVGGVIKHPGKPSKEELDELRKQFAMKHQGRRKSWAFGVLTGGAELVPTALKPAEADLEPLWRQVLEAACRIYHIPTHLVASQDPGAAARSSVEERGIAYVRHAIRPFVRRLEPIYSALIPGDDTFVRFNLNGLMQGNADARAKFYNLMLQGKTMKREEVRDLEDLPYDGELGYLETPNNNSDAPADTGDRGVNLSIHDAPTNIHPELRIDSVAVSEAGVERIAEASTTGIAAGIAQLGDGLERQNTTLSETFMAAAVRLEESQRLILAQQAELEQRLADAEAREAERNQPVSFHVEKDAKGQTVSILEQRGTSVIRKRIDRDETGQVLSVVAEA